MSQPTDSPDAFTIDRHGEVTVIEPSPILEQIPPQMVDGAAALVLEAIRRRTIPLVVVDLGQIGSFGSAFLALLIRLWKDVSTRGGTMVVSGASPAARELLRLTKLDTVWPLYETRREAIDSLVSD